MEESGFIRRDVFYFQLNGKMTGLIVIILEITKSKRKVKYGHGEESCEKGSSSLETIESRELTSLKSSFATLFSTPLKNLNA